MLFKKQLLSIRSRIWSIWFIDCEFCFKKINFRSSYQNYQKKQKKNQIVAVRPKSASILYQCQHHAVFTMRQLLFEKCFCYVKKLLSLRWGIGVMDCEFCLKKTEIRIKSTWKIILSLFVINLYHSYTSVSIMLSLQYEKPLGPTLMYINIDIKEKPFTFSIYAVLLHVTIYRNSRNPYLIYF